MELEIKHQRITDSVAKRRTAGHDSVGRRPAFDRQLNLQRPSHHRLR